MLTELFTVELPEALNCKADISCWYAWHIPSLRRTGPAQTHPCILDCVLRNLVAYDVTLIELLAVELLDSLNICNEFINC